MADGGQAEATDSQIERAARRLAAALSMGSSWLAHTVERHIDGPDDEQSPAGALSIASRGRVLEQAAKGFGVTQVRRLQQWRLSPVSVGIPVHKPDSDALAALAIADLGGPLEAILRLYATEDGDQWPTVARYAKASYAARNMTLCREDMADLALGDALWRLLRRRAPFSQDDRARQLGVRASTYRGQTAFYEALLRRWLATASVRFLAALGTARSV